MGPWAHGPMGQGPVGVGPMGPGPLGMGPGPVVLGLAERKKNSDDKKHVSQLSHNCKQLFTGLSARTHRFWHMPDRMVPSPGIKSDDYEHLLFEQKNIGNN